MTEELVRVICEWCSGFVTPDPQGYVYVFPLFDMLSEHTGIPNEQIGEWFNTQQERNGR